MNGSRRRVHALSVKIKRRIGAVDTYVHGRHHDAVSSTDDRNSSERTATFRVDDFLDVNYDRYIILLSQWTNGKTNFLFFSLYHYKAGFSLCYFTFYRTCRRSTVLRGSISTNKKIINRQTNQEKPKRSVRVSPPRCYTVVVKCQITLVCVIRTISIDLVPESITYIVIMGTNDCARTDGRERGRGTAGLVRLVRHLS